jgi:hypothetical protein
VSFIPGEIRNTYPQITIAPNGVRRAGPVMKYVVGTIPVFNDSVGNYPPGSVLITGANFPRWSCGKLSAGADVPPIYMPCDFCDDSANFQSRTFLGVTLQDIPAGAWGLAATAGSIVPVRCNDASVDTPLGILGTWVRWSTNTDDDPNGSLGCVESVTANAMISATAATSRPGTIVGQVIVPAGVGDTKTGSIFTCVIRINPR